jgi:hypothetical protein
LLCFVREKLQAGVVFHLVPHFEECLQVVL